MGSSEDDTDGSAMNIGAALDAYDGELDEYFSVIVLAFKQLSIQIKVMNQSENEQQQPLQATFRSYNKLISILTALQRTYPKWIDKLKDDVEVKSYKEEIVKLEQMNQSFQSLFEAQPIFFQTFFANSI